MPPAIIAAVITAATTLGVTGYEIANQPGTPAQPAAPTPTQITNQAVQAETANRSTATKEAGQILPDLQYATGGGLSPDAYQSLASQFSGNAQYGDTASMQQLVARFLGLDQSGASFGSNPTSPGLTSGGG